MNGHSELWMEIHSSIAVNGDSQLHPAAQRTSTGTPQVIAANVLAAQVLCASNCCVSMPALLSTSLADMFVWLLIIYQKLRHTPSHVLHSKKVFFLRLTVLLTYTTHFVVLGESQKFQRSLVLSLPGLFLWHVNTKHPSWVAHFE